MKRLIICFLTIFLFATCNSNTVSAEIVGRRTLGLNEKVQESLSIVGYDQYDFSADETQFYKFEFENQSIETNLNIGFADELLNFFVGKMTVSIYDENNKQLAKKDIKCGYNESISLKLQSDMKYYIYVDSAVTGNYSVVVKKLADLGGDTWNSASKIQRSGIISAAIDVGYDEDWYSFETSSMESFLDYKAENISGGHKEIEIYEYIEGAGEFPLKSIQKTSLYAGNSITLNFQLKTNSTYYISVKSSSEGGYILELQQNIDSLSGEMKNAYKIETEKEYVSSFDGDKDYDWMKFKTSGSDAYYEVVFKNLGDDHYTTVAIHDESGNEIKKVRQYAKEININEKLETDRTYYLCLYGEKVGNYTFIVDKAEDMYSNYMNDAELIKINEEYVSSFDGDKDYDWMKFKTSGSDAYYEVVFKNLGNDHYTTVAIHDESGNEIKKVRQYAKEININEKLETNKTYYLCLYGEDVGKYSVLINEKSDTVADVKEKAQLIELNNEHQASLETSNDVDWYKIYLENGLDLEVNLLNESSSHVAIEMFSERDMSLLKTNIYSIGKAVKNHLVDKAGTYFIKISGNTGNYTILLRESGKLVETNEAGETKESPKNGRILLTIGKKEANVFGEKITNDVAPIIRNSRTMLPARFVAERLGAIVSWYANEEKVVIKSEECEIVIYINSSAAYVNDKKVILDSPAFIENERTYTPVRFIVENLGATVDWIPETQQVVIVK